MLYMRKRCSVPGTKHVGIIAEVAMTKTEIQEIVAQAVKAAMSEAGRRAGSATSPAKARAARLNGQKGGRPRTTTTDARRTKPRENQRTRKRRTNEP
jgi:hypothetical protein